MSIVAVLMSLRGARAEGSPMCTVRGTVSAANSGAPLAAAEIVVSKEGSSEFPLAVSTDGAGRYFTGGLDPGRYSIVVKRSGYLDRMYGQRGGIVEGVPLVCRAGEDLDKIDFQLVATGVIAGRVVGEDGQPRVGAKVQALRSHYVRGERHFGEAAHASTNDLGEFRIYGLAPGRYLVITSEEDPWGHQPIRRPKGVVSGEEYIPTFYPHASDPDHAVTVDVPTGGEAAGTDIVALKSRTFHIRGKLQPFDEGDHYARVKLAGVGDWVISGIEADLAPDGQGNFEFDGLSPGSYVVSTSLAHSGNFEGAWQLLEIQGADVNDVTLTPTTGMRLPGRIKVDGDRKLDFTKVTAELFNAYSPTRSWARVKDDGGFVLHSVRPHIYKIRISGLPDDFYLESVRMGDEEITGTSIDLSRSDGPLGALEVVVSASCGRVDGVVRDDKGEPIGGASVVLVPDLIHRQDGDLFKERLSDQDGRFVFRGIRPGAYKLFAWADIDPGAWWNPKFLGAYEKKGEAIDVGANGHVTRDLRLISTNSQ